MRITGTILMNQALDAMRLTLGRLAKSQARIASGRQVLSPADDPAGQGSVTRLAARQSRIDQWERQGERTRAYIETNDRLLARLTEIVGRVQTLAVTGADGTQGATERAALATEVNDLLEEVSEIANSLDDGRYVFGGRETLTPPLVLTRNAQNQITAASWNPRGVDATRDIEIAEGVTVQANLGGTTVLGTAAATSFLPGVLITLRDRLAANDGEGVRGTMTNLDGAAGRLNTVVAETGARQRQVERALQDLDDDRVATAAALSAIVDTDVARAATELSQQEIAYQASLQVAAKAIQPSLMDFIR